MRIIAGNARGRRLLGPGDDRIRPTSDRIRESVFAILGDLEGVLVVDGFAGTGALGCEALSRGARKCYFFDASREAIALIEENVARIGEADRAVVWLGKFERGMARVDDESEEPDLIFLDPPYGTNLAQQALNTLALSPAITRGALVVVEQAVSDEPPTSDAFELDDARTYGHTRVTWLRRR